MRKLTAPQVECLRYFQAIANRLTATERRAQKITFPDKRTEKCMVEAGLVAWVNVPNPLYKGPEGLHYPTMAVPRITAEGKKELAMRSLLPVLSVL